MMSSGQVYRCPICGAEVTVIRAGSGRLTPRCCNTGMILKEKPSRVFHCPTCGAQVTVIKEGKGNLEPRCCNAKMALVELQQN
ncbi:MAG: hypothetical protein QME81_18635 [bacterium]|nr:hypothetical protein [bacterium]